MALAKDLAAAGGIAAWLWLASLALVLLTSAVSLFGPWARGSAPLRWAISGAPATTFLISLGAAGGIIASARRATIERGLALAPPTAHEPWKMVALQIDLALFGACLLALLAPVVALAAARPWMVPGRRAVIALVASGAGGLSFVALTSVFVETLDLVGALQRASWMDPARKFAEVYRALDASTRTLELERMAVASAGVLLAVFAAVASARAVRRSHRAGAPALLAALLVLAGGAVLHSLARPLAADAASPPTLPPRLDPYVSVPDGLPFVERCPRAEQELAPSVTFDRVVELDGRRMRAPANLEQDLGTYRRNWDILHPTRGWPGVLLVWAPAKLPSARLGPWLRAASRVGMPHVRLAVVTQTTLRTRSLGIVSYRRQCLLPVTLDAGPDAVPLSTLGDVGAITRRAMARPLRVNVSR